MKLAHFDFESTFLLEVGKVNVLVIEKEQEFYSRCKEMYDQINGRDGGFCLSEGNNILPLSKMAVFFSDYLSLLINDKKNSAKLYSSLQKIVEQSFLYEYQEICAKISDLLQKLNAESECPIQFDGEDCLGGIFKSFGVGVADGDTLLEQLQTYIHINNVFFNTKCFFFMNLKTILSESNLCLLYHEAALLGVNIFLLENTIKPKLDGEVVTVIDRDLCEIVV